MNLVQIKRDKKDWEVPEVKEKQWPFCTQNNKTSRSRSWSECATSCNPSLLYHAPFSRLHWMFHQLALFKRVIWPPPPIANQWEFCDFWTWEHIIEIHPPPIWEIRILWFWTEGQISETQLLPGGLLRRLHCTGRLLSRFFLFAPLRGF